MDLENAEEKSVSQERVTYKENSEIHFMLHAFCHLVKFVQY